MGELVEKSLTTLPSSSNAEKALSYNA